MRVNKDRPFFLYYATTVPHLALQVPRDSLEQYAGKFPEETYHGDRDYLPHRQPRAAYAAMITRMDREVGRLLTLIEQLGLDERTLVVFTSDNGPVYDRLGGTDSDFFNSGRIPRSQGLLLRRWLPRAVPRSLERSDRPGEHKRPRDRLRGLAADSRRADRGQGRDARRRGRPQFRRHPAGRHPAAAPLPLPRVSGLRRPAVRGAGDWKALRRNMNPGPTAKDQAPGEIELYDLALDPGEKNDVAGEHPDVVARLRALMELQHATSDLFPIRALDDRK